MTKKNIGTIVSEKDLINASAILIDTSGDYKMYEILNTYYLVEGTVVKAHFQGVFKRYKSK